MSETRAPASSGQAGPRSRGVLVFLVLAGAALTAFFAGLGIWQVERLAWKLDLIERVEARIHAEAVDAPSRDEWPAVAPETHEYRHVSLQGRFLHENEALVQAVTDAGPGFWVMTPLLRENGETVLVNRGFVPSDRREAATRAQAQVEGPVRVEGLLRITEPDGAFLRSNAPEEDRWFSRDVAAIAQARGLASAAPYFVDAEASPNPGGFPQGGLTVVSFRNHHVVYALTWFALALMVAGATVFVLLDARRRRSRAASGESPLPACLTDRLR